MNWQKRCACGHAGEKSLGEYLHFYGWVDAIRDHGHLRFIHLRDASGIVQIVFDPKSSQAAFDEAGLLRNEYIIEVSGTLRPREAGTENSQLESGRVEVVALQLSILNTSPALPFQVSEKAMLASDAHLESQTPVDEELRLYHRYLDLRRPSVQRSFRARHQVMRHLRKTLDDAGFLELETPILTKSTPEGARDFLVPSRTQHRNFYALPQSPQLFKQLFMMGGLERYYQIVRCFRDEDLRPNRQPEFTQLDIEASFIDESFIYQLTESLITAAFAACDQSLEGPFPTLSYDQAMGLYGSDKPDLRPGMPFFDATDIFENTRYGIFSRITAAKGLIKGITVKGAANHFSKNELQNQYCQQIVPQFGGKGMTWMKVADGKLQSNIVQFFSDEEKAKLLARSQAENGDVIMMIADGDHPRVLDVLGKLRLHVARALDLLDDTVFKPLWVVDWPLFEANEGQLKSMHHPFTMPDSTQFDENDAQSLLELRARAYDIVINGEELGGGSIRISDRALQSKVFNALGIDESAQTERFGFFLRALSYGAPPHGGIALGLDRLVSMALGKSSIREVIAFPKNRRGICPLSEAPTAVDEKQLQELGLLTPKRKRRWVS